jgi:hypothetical protein
MTGDTILDFGFWIVEALLVGSFKNSNVASLNPNGISGKKIVVVRSPSYRY